MHSENQRRRISRRSKLNRSRLFGFYGRINRRTFLLHEVISIGTSAVSFFVDYLLGSVPAFHNMLWVTSALFLLSLAFTIITSLSTTVRRLHDLNAPGWGMIVIFIPFIGGMIALSLFVAPGKPTANRFGDVPKGFKMGVHTPEGSPQTEYSKFVPDGGDADVRTD